MTKKNNNKKNKKDILLVLDLNGILFDRRRKTRNSNKDSFFNILIQKSMLVVCSWYAN